jgi:hypothetical protein
MSKVPADVPTTIFISPMPKMCFYAVASMEIIYSIPLAPETTLRHERFDNMREVPFDEFVACHPQSRKCVAQLTDFFLRTGALLARAAGRANTVDHFSTTQTAMATQSELSICPRQVSGLPTQRISKTISMTWKTTTARACCSWAAFGQADAPASQHHCGKALDVCQFG